jgi:hypothetical protein
MRRHYVYYRVPVALAAEARAAAAALQAALRERFPGLHTALLRRPEATAGRVTLMEVYTLPGRDLDGGLASAIESLAGAALSRWADGPRHVETFELLDEGG